MNQPQIAYISFDIVPAPKGAAIHIAAFSQSLAAAFGHIQLVTVSPTTEQIENHELFPQVMQIMLPAVGRNLISRVLYFQNLLRGWLQNRHFAAIHIRSIYEGFVIALNKKQYCDQLIFEVNGLPSIELKYRYPGVVEDRELLHKLNSQEQICLAAADLIITPSHVTAAYLQSRDVPANKIRVIPNGVDLDVFTYNHNCGSDTLAAKINYTEQAFTPAEVIKMIYFGTLSPWQGVNLAIEALELINKDVPAYLTVIGQAKDDQIKKLQQLALKLGIVDKLTILEPISQTQLVEHIHASDIILAPLMPSDRNLLQGCCPLKILEGMATGVPVIASDLPVVRELGEDSEHFLLVKPGSAKAIKDAVLQLHHHPELATKLAQNARQRIEKYYTWKLAGEALTAAYAQLGIKRLSKI
ncbi:MULTISPECIES: glycosyltransferase family 4 protein [Cyanophyceae]|uniref:glycosyltransferase family 4 protein n=1 Tax=Cyanophyceae TaxID=3028117 RepID=UPI0023305E8A|nr:MULTISPECIES: glycosyltransferase family 4 protein [Cyanophyceae]MDB9355212.1 glycosyltransferase family 4 protein [Nodularia spumigena CS-587/03]MDB9306202.1 glycosyltransferase family 4 protein [Nodularia spumigena CS-591/12]MDB9318840.1 glycosyltransferase family 4 protein [Nodularia spumigena CS-590/01A]MDB9326381.1 glycosyltransferase family 4 protein [Nodularia spumigena CS-590/02]MDB9337076.1 glycosyltransferase family 4 protein [Nodularia spumigena CS-590/01]